MSFLSPSLPSNRTSETNRKWSDGFAALRDEIFALEAWSTAGAWAQANGSSSARGSFCSADSERHDEEPASKNRYTGPRDGDGRSPSKDG